VEEERLCVDEELPPALDELLPILLLCSVRLYSRLLEIYKRMRLIYDRREEKTVVS